MIVVVYILLWEYKIILNISLQLCYISPLYLHQWELQSCWESERQCEIEDTHTHTPTHTHTHRAAWSVWGLGGDILTPSINPLSSRRHTHTQTHTHTNAWHFSMSGRRCFISVDRQTVWLWFTMTTFLFVHLCLCACTLLSVTILIQKWPSDSARSSDYLCIIYMTGCLLVCVSVH